MRTDRKEYLDLLRIIAICAVVMIHISGYYVVNYKSLLDFTLGNIFDSISRLGVPIFLMISGALMLDEKREFNCKKRILALVLPFCVWSVIYTFVNMIVLPALKNQPFGFSGFVTTFLCGPTHLWYMWAIAGLYLITPILRTFVKKENKEIIFYFVALSLLLRFTAPLVTILFSAVDFGGWESNIAGAYSYISEKLNLDFLGGLTTYYLAGWLLANTDFEQKRKTIIYIFGGISLVSVVLLTQMFPTQYNSTYSNYSILVFFYSAATFLFVKDFHPKSTKAGAVLADLSKLSFGVYLVHMLVITAVSYILPKNPFLIPLNFLVTTLISFAITYVISKIPFIKKIIKG